MRDEARAGARAKSQGLCSVEFPRKETTVQLELAR